MCKGPAAFRSRMHLGCAHQEVMAETREGTKGMVRERRLGAEQEVGTQVLGGQSVRSVPSL